MIRSPSITPVLSALFATYLALVPKAAVALQGCYLDGYCFLGSCDEGDLISGFSDLVIDVYLDDSFWSQPYINNIPEALAEEMIKQQIAAVHSELGTDFTYRYRGRSGPGTAVGDLVCGSTNFVAPTLVINATPPDEGVGPLPGCSGNNQWACARWARDVDLTYCGWIFFEGGRDNSDMVPSQFREALLHELGHTLNVAHPTEEWCGNRESRMTLMQPACCQGFYNYTMADKRVFLDDYGDSQQWLMWRRVSPFGQYGFSAPTQLYQSDATLGPLSLSTSNQHRQGIAFPELEGREHPWIDSYVYEPPAWSLERLFSEFANMDYTFYRPGIATTFSDDPAGPLWAVGAMSGDTWSQGRTDLTVAVEGFWSVDLALQTTRPYVSMAYDPVSNRFVVATVSSGGIPALRIVNPNTGAYGPSTSVPNEAVMSDRQVFGGVDIACSPDVNTVWLRNCVMVAKQDYRTPAGGGDRLVGNYRIWPFIVGGNDVISISPPIALAASGHMAPRVVARPIPGADPMFIYSFTAWNEGAGTFQTRIWDQYRSENVPPFHIATTPDVSAWSYAPPALGAHVYNNVPYLDLGYTEP